MILGDPYKFSIFIQTIKEWNYDDTFNSGVLLFCVNGDIFPKEIHTMPLNYEISELETRLKNLGVDKALFAMEKTAAYKAIYNMRSPEDSSIANDYRFDITPLTFLENDYCRCCIFAVSNGCQVRFLAAKLKYNRKKFRDDLENISISEAFTSVEELDEIVTKLKVY